MPGPGKYSSSKEAEEAAWRSVGKTTPKPRKPEKKKPKPKPTPGQKAEGTRQSIIEATPGTTGLQLLQEALTPKPKKKK